MIDGCVVSVEASEFNGVEWMAKKWYSVWFDVAYLQAYKKEYQDEFNVLYSLESTGKENFDDLFSEFESTVKITEKNPRSSHYLKFKEFTNHGKEEKKS